MSEARMSTIIVAPAGTSAAASANSGPINVAGHVSFAIQCTWLTFDAADATFKLQSSLDGTNWNDYPSSSVTATATSDNKVFDFPTGSGVLMMRVVFTHGTVTAAGSYGILAKLTRVVF